MIQGDYGDLSMIGQTINNLWIQLVTYCSMMIGGLSIRDLINGKITMRYRGLPG